MCHHLVAESTPVSRLVCRVVVGRLAEFVSGHPRPSLLGNRFTVGVLAGTHRCATDSRVTPWQAQTLVVCCWSRDVVCALRSCSVVFRPHVQLRIHTFLEKKSFLEPSRKRYLPGGLFFFFLCFFLRFLFFRCVFSFFHVFPLFSTCVSFNFMFSCFCFCLCFFSLYVSFSFC